jgi:protein-S-isoprenylcysteine O-methyltransferase Ste14
MQSRYIKALELYAASIFVYGFGLLLLLFGPYYRDFLSFETKQTLLILYLAFLALSPFYYLLFSTKYSENKPALILNFFFRSIFHRKLSIGKAEKNALLFLLVKIFFLPIMLNFFWGNGRALLNQPLGYGFILTLIFTLDTLIFSFGYIFEFKTLKNVVKSVEPTFLGWFVALISYPPFNNVTGDYIPWGANEYVSFGLSTTLMHTLIVILLLIYLSASFRLGAKASNLTNRGIVTRFPYSIVRHPAYISKNTVWWLTLLPVMSTSFALGMLFWTFIYFLRAWTEERHLRNDPDYIAYCKKVKYRFIPYLF